MSLITADYVPLDRAARSPLVDLLFEDAKLFSNFRQRWVGHDVNAATLIESRDIAVECVLRTQLPLVEVELDLVQPCFIG